MLTSLLIVEDDPLVTDFLKRGLEEEGYSVETCSTGNAAVQKVLMNTFPFLILDRMLPDDDGISVCSKLREQGYNGYILFLTAKDAIADRIEGLKSGADDYLCKPFDFDELLIRLEVLKRRNSTNNELISERQISQGPLQIDLERHVVKFNGEIINLTKREFELLHYFIINNNKILSRSQILSAVWGYNFEPGTKLVEVYIRYLRKKFDNGRQNSIIESVRGFGYRLKV